MRTIFVLRIIIENREFPIIISFCDVKTCNRQFKKSEMKLVTFSVIQNKKNTFKRGFFSFKKISVGLDQNLQICFSKNILKIEERKKKKLKMKMEMEMRRRRRKGLNG